MEASLRSISCIAQELADITAPTIVRNRKLSPPPLCVPSLDLPVPPTLRTAFEGSKVKPEVINLVSRRFFETVTALQHTCTVQYEQACRDFMAVERTADAVSADTVLNKLRSAFQGLYRQQVSVWVEERFRQCQMSIAGISSSRQTHPFNFEYVPLLENYFENNSFPSHADKAHYAKKSLMTYRQIDVWFQNRRSRARKEGKILKRLPTDSAPQLSLDTLEKRMPNRIIPAKDRIEPVDSDVSEYEWQDDLDEDEDVSAWIPKYPRNPGLTDAFNFKAPPHAFPHKYPASCGYDPFPRKSGNFTFPAPVWTRQPMKRTVEQPVVDLDIVTKAFDRMSLREGVKKRWEKKKRQAAPRAKSTCPSGSRRDRSAATLFITTKPLSAPLPSLVQPIASSLATPPTITVFSSVPAPVSRRHVFPSPSPQSKPITLVPLPHSVAATEKLPGQRKIARLPKRTPAGTHRGHTPASSPAVSASPAQSRISSLRSDSQTRTCSDSSSSPSSTVATPISPSTSLPDPGFAFSDLFGDTPMNALSPVDGLQLDFGSIGGVKKSIGFPCSPAHFLRAQS